MGKLIVKSLSLFLSLDRSIDRSIARSLLLSLSLALSLDRSLPLLSSDLIPHQYWACGERPMEKLIVKTVKRVIPEAPPPLPPDATVHKTRICFWYCR